MSIQDEFELAKETVAGLLRDNVGINPVKVQAIIARHLMHHGASLDEETKMILRVSMVIIGIMRQRLGGVAQRGENHD